LAVSDSTLRDDRGLKQQIYAHARIPEYWIVNLIERQLEIYQRPSMMRMPMRRIM
jgi:Uma2 family endonuclease